jgi:hypothetical protein
MKQRSLTLRGGLRRGVNIRCERVRLLALADVAATRAVIVIARVIRSTDPTIG